jgi:hypothetical protein
VPLWIEQLRQLPFAEVQRQAKECCDMVAHHGDNILYRSKKKGESAKAFNALAKGLACLAFAPGGVNAFGGHWQTNSTK